MVARLNRRSEDAFGDRLDAVVNVRFKQGEKDRLQETARHAGMSVSTLVRRWCLGRKVIADEDAATIRELCRIAGLIQGVHTESNGAYRERMVELLDQLGAAIDRIARDRQEGP